MIVESLPSCFAGKHAKKSPTNQQRRDDETAKCAAKPIVEEIARPNTPTPGRQLSAREAALNAPPGGECRKPGQHTHRDEACRHQPISVLHRAFLPNVKDEPRRERARLVLRDNLLSVASFSNLLR